MSTDPPHILIIGAADTGRAPMAATLLRRLLHRRGLEWPVTSAGVVGHDEQPAETEARDAIAFLNLDISQHQARSLSAELADSARVMIAIDSGVARVLQARHPQATISSLGELAGRRRDVPDPFRMQVGAWVSYAREIEALLIAGLDRLIALVEGQPAPEAQPAPQAQPAPEADAGPRHAAIDRCLRLLALLAEMPEAIDWAGASRQMLADMPALGAPLTREDLSRPYVAIIQAMLGLTARPPTPGQAARLHDALAALRAPIRAEDLAALSADLASYPAR